jgi:cell wall-associated NlpC family hydrolase
MEDTRRLRSGTLSGWVATLAVVAVVYMGLASPAVAMTYSSAHPAELRASVHITGSVSSALVLEVRGRVRPALAGAHVVLEVESPTGRWTRTGPSVRLSRHGTFSISAHIGASRTVSIRAVISRDGRTLARSGRLILPISSGSVLGDKEASPGSSTPAASTPLPSAGLLNPPTSSPPPPVTEGPGSDLMPGERLEPGAYLLSPNHEYELVMQTDGNLVLYQSGTALWSSETGGDIGAYAVMQAEGNLVIYREGVAVWDSSTWGFPGAYLKLQNDSNAVIYQAGHPVWDWMSGYIGDELNGWMLEPGAYLLSPSHEYQLIMQTDGNLVLYHSGTALWSSQTGGDIGDHAVMQTDGNLVIYKEGVAVWDSSTWGFPGAYLELQKDSNAVIYQSGHPVWDWMSGYIGDELNGWMLEPGAYLLSPSHEYQLIMQTDGNLVLYHSGTALWSSKTGGDTGAYAVMQADGNFVIYSSGVARWSTETAGYPGAYLALQSDSNVVVYQGSTALWDWSSGKLVGGGGGGSTGERILDEAAKWAGRPYCFDGGEPNGPTLGQPDPEDGPDYGLFCGINGYDHSATPGFDCTGLTLYAVYQVTGKVLAHEPGQATDAVSQGGQRISNESELQPGDIVYFGSSFGDITHAGVYAGRAKGGKPAFWSAVTEYVGVELETMAWEEAGEPFVGAVRF